MEIKRYPGVRRAEYEVEGGPADRRARSTAFGPLFRHISSRDIAMTSPVEMDFSEEELSSTMSFLYESVDDGPAGEDNNGVRVVDVEPQAVLSLGVRGSLDREGLRSAIRKLEGWISSQSAWDSTGSYRWVGYNGPYIRPADQWIEVQVMLEPRAEASP
ncbi:MAG: heme-binding protein [Planctomycetota bacterium]